MRLIDADEVLARIENPYQKAEIARWLRDSPTIEERKKGKWHSRIYSKIEMFVCSECQHEYSYDAETGEQFYNFCPNCGSYNGGEWNETD